MPIDAVDDPLYRRRVEHAHVARPVGHAAGAQANRLHDERPRRLLGRKRRVPARAVERAHPGEQPVDPGMPGRQRQRDVGRQTELLVGGDLIDHERRHQEQEGARGQLG